MTDRRIKVKICGVTNERDLDAACEAGADYIGFNFYKPSPRWVSVEQARLLRDRMPVGIDAVGVFVNMSLADVESIVLEARLDWVQFHGDETATSVAPVADRSLRALRVGDSFRTVDVNPWTDCWGLLFDAPAEGLYGGSGEAWAYSKVNPAVEACKEKGCRTFLAGGLTPDNVVAAVQALPSIYAVDVCSGIEECPGKKDHALLQQFFDRLSGMRLSRVSGQLGVNS